MNDMDNARSYSPGRIAMNSQSPQFGTDERVHIGLSYQAVAPKMARKDSKVDFSPSTPGSSQFLHSPSFDRLLMTDGEYTTRPRGAAFASSPLRWRSSWNMYVFFVFGVACAIGHHLFYNALDGKPADNQILMLRYGTILAFGTKAGLCAAVVTAFRQRIWTTVRTRFLGIGMLDSLFAAPEDLTTLWNWKLFKSARTAMAMAAFVW